MNSGSWAEEEKVVFHHMESELNKELKKAESHYESIYNISFFLRFLGMNVPYQNCE